MINIGQYNRLTALRMTSVGMYLGDDDDNDVLLPNKYVPDELKEGDNIEVFIYTDSEDRPIATTLRPAVIRDSFAALKCVALSSFGAFMDWGLEKDLLVPTKAQEVPMAEGRWYVVYCGYDADTDRLIGSSKINALVVDEAPEDLKEGDEVTALIYERTDLGLIAVVNDQFRGLFYANELFKSLRIGDKVKAYVKRIREDLRVDLSLQPVGYAKVEPNAQAILDKLKAKNGFLPLTDSSDPQAIYQLLEMSKKTFKKAVGALYKDRKIVLKEDGIYLA
ncbi:S1-like domain-containing RNA-binding protein [Fibrella sp. ES10-3-2-2]|nr:GntR family transcriptional regulator [Fibrella sp. ES10-3-2-2]